MRKWILGLAALLMLNGAAFAVATQNYVPGALIVKTLAGAFSLPINTTGPQSAIVPLNGGQFTCNSSTPVVVAAATVDAGSVILYGSITPSTPAIAPYTSSVTVGTGFSVTCQTSDVSVYNYIVLG